MQCSLGAQCVGAALARFVVPACAQLHPRLAAHTAAPAVGTQQWRHSDSGVLCPFLPQPAKTAAAAMAATAAEASIMVAIVVVARGG